MDLTLIDAFARFGATPARRLGALSAIAADGAVVLNCSHSQFVRPARGVLRYEDKLSRDADPSREIDLLRRNLELARDRELPVRMIVATPPDPANGRRGRGFHVRTDLVGRLVEFDGDHFIVDFTRVQEPREAARRRS